MFVNPASPQRVDTFPSIVGAISLTFSRDGEKLAVLKADGIDILPAKTPSTGTSPSIDPSSHATSHATIHRAPSLRCFHAAQWRRCPSSDRVCCVWPSRRSARICSRGSDGRSRPLLPALLLLPRPRLPPSLLMTTRPKRSRTRRRRRPRCLPLPRPAPRLLPLLFLRPRPTTTCSFGRSRAAP